MLCGLHATHMASHSFPCSASVSQNEPDNTSLPFSCFVARYTGSQKRPTKKAEAYFLKEKQVRQFVCIQLMEPHQKSQKGFFGTELRMKL